MAHSHIPGASSDYVIDTGQIRRDMATRKVGKIGMLLSPITAYFFLWAPILVLVTFSFNDSASVSIWNGFTFDWYRGIFSASSGTANFQTDLMLRSLRNSLIVAVSATIISTTIGTMLALALQRSSFTGKRFIRALLYLPVVIPEITQGISLALFFKILFDYVDSGTGFRMMPGFGTIIIAHVAFNISFVTIVVLARLANMNPRLEEAARDLGANEWQTFWRITFPLLLPGILAGALLALTLSLDDFVVTFFTSGIGTDTLSIYVYGMLKQRVSPEINAISTLMIIVSMLLVGVSLVLQNRNARQS